MAKIKKFQEIKPEINDLIFKELIKRGYSLEGNTRVWDIADSKLWYLTPEQAQAYLDLEDSENFKKLASNAEFELLHQNMDEIQSEIGNCPINLVDLGCGDGKKAAYVFERLKNKKIRYCPIDISGYMVQKAKETFSKLDVDEIAEFRYNISDFENLENITPLLSSDNFKKSLFLLLGYTLGNFEINELLYEIKCAMKEGDVLVIVSGIASEKWQEWIDEVNDEKKVKMNSFLIKIPMQLGLSKDEVEFGARFKNSRVEYYYIVKKDKLIEFQGKSAYFNKGDQIIVAVAYKHKKDKLLTILNMHFNRVTLKVSKDGSTALALCRK